MQLRLTNGTTTVSLSGTAPVLGCAYVPQPPASDVLRSAAMGLDGESLVTFSRRNVTESAVVVLEGTAASVLSTITAVERLFAETGERVRTGLGPRVFVEFQTHTGADWYRSEIFQGVVAWPDNPARASLDASTNALEMRLAWERTWYWEGPSTALQWVNQGAPGTPLSSVSITNGDTGTNENNAQVYQVLGDVPTPLVLQIANSSGASLSVPTGYLMLDNGLVGLAKDQNFLGGGTWTWGSAIDHATFAINVSVPDAVLQKTQGRHFRILAAFSGISSGVYVRANVQHYVNPIRVRLDSGNEVYVPSSGAKLVDLGVLALPPGGNVATTGVEIGLSFYYPAAGSATLSFLHLAPASGARKVEQLGFGWSNGDAWVDDGLEGIAYYASGGTRYPILRPSGPPLLLLPGRTNVLRALIAEAGFTATRTFTVSGSYRPRRLSL